MAVLGVCSVPSDSRPPGRVCGSSQPLATSHEPATSQQWAESSGQRAEHALGRGEERGGVLRRERDSERDMERDSWR